MSWSVQLTLEAFQHVGEPIGYAIFDWPEHTHTSPKSTLSRVIVVPSEVAVMLYFSVSEDFVAGSFASHVDFFIQTLVVAAMVCPPKETETLLPWATNPQTVACAGARCSTMPSPCEDANLKGGGGGAGGPEPTCV